jgi:hypothetical protein
LFLVQVNARTAMRRAAKSAIGRVLPATALMRATAAQRIAGTQ